MNLRILSCVTSTLLLTVSGVLTAQQAQTPPSSVRLSAGDCVRHIIPLTILRIPASEKLDAHDLRVTVDGKAVAVTSLQRQDIAPRVALLVDTSSSMRREGDHHPWEIGYLTSKLAMETVAPDSKIALIPFNKEAQVLGFEDKATVSRRLDELRDTPPKGTTAIYTAIEGALRVFEKPQFGDVIYIVSDGGDNIGAETSKSVAKALMERGIRVFVLGVGDRAFHTTDERYGMTDLASLAHMTGGNIFVFTLRKDWEDNEDSRKLVRMLAAQVRVPYEVKFQLPSPVMKEQKVSVTPVSNDYEFAYPRRVEPCTAGNAANQP